jgi:hypothetical protein
MSDRGKLLLIEPCRAAQEGLAKDAEEMERHKALVAGAE